MHGRATPVFAYLQEIDIECIASTLYSSLNLQGMQFAFSKYISQACLVCIFSDTQTNIQQNLIIFTKIGLDFFGDI